MIDYFNRKQFCKIILFVKILSICMKYHILTILKQDQKIIRKLYLGTTVFINCLKLTFSTINNGIEQPIINSCPIASLIAFCRGC